jgi:hypothetical protein
MTFAPRPAMRPWNSRVKHCVRAGANFDEIREHTRKYAQPLRGIPNLVWTVLGAKTAEFRKRKCNCRMQIPGLRVCPVSMEQLQHPTGGGADFAQALSTDPLRRRVIMRPPPMGQILTARLDYSPGQLYLPVNR